MVVNGRTGLLSNAPIEISGAGLARRAACVYEKYEDVGNRFRVDFQGIENWAAEFVVSMTWQ